LCKGAGRLAKNPFGKGPKSSGNQKGGNGLDASAKTKVKITETRRKKREQTKVRKGVELGVVAAKLRTGFRGLNLEAQEERGKMGVPGKYCGGVSVNNNRIYKKKEGKRNLP